MHDLQALGERLAALSPAQLALVPMPDDLREALVDSRTITKHEARRRHLQFIGRLMRDVDAAPMREVLARWDGQSASATRALHAVERWRDRLLDDDQAFTDFARQHPGADLQAIRTAIREARKTRRTDDGAAANRGSRHFRELFRLLRDALERAAGEPSRAPEAST